MKNFQLQVGFTLIELLVAVSIMGVLAALLLVNMQGMRGRARDTQRKNDLYQLKNALRMYYNDHQHYPASDGNGNIVGCGEVGETTCSWGDTFGPAAGIYMKVLPDDPLNAQDSDYVYFYTSTGADDYTLYACLENASDPTAADAGASCPSTKKTEVSND